MAYPLLWTVLPHAGNSDTQERLALIDRLLTLLSPERIEALVADREFIGEDCYGGPDYGDKTFRHSSSGYLASLGAAVIAARKSSKPRLKRLLGA